MNDDDQAQITNEPETDPVATEPDTPVDVDDTRTDFEKAVDAGEAKILELLTEGESDEAKETADVIRALIDSAQDFVHDLADAIEISAAAPADGAGPGQSIDAGGTLTDTAAAAEQPKDPEMPTEQPAATALPDDPAAPPTLASTADDGPAQAVPSPQQADAPAPLGGDTGEEPAATALPD